MNFLRLEVGRIESPLGERCHTRIRSRRVRALTKKAAQCGTTLRVVQVRIATHSESRTTPRTQPQRSFETPLGERCHTRIRSSEGSTLTKKACPVWDHSPSGPRPNREPLHGPSRSGAGFEDTSRREVPHSDTFFGGVEPHQRRRPSVGPLSEWSTSNRNPLHGPSRSAADVVRSHLSERGATLGSFFGDGRTLTKKASQCGTTLRVVQVESQPLRSNRSKTAAAASLNHLSERGATLGSLLGGVEPHQEGGPVWDHSPSGPSENRNPLRIVNLSRIQPLTPAAEVVRITSRREVPHSDRSSEGSISHQEGGPVWDHSPSGPGRIATNLHCPSRSGAVRSHLSERGATLGSFFGGVELSPRRRPSVGPLSEWSKWNRELTVHCPSRSGCRLESPLGERCHTRIRSSEGSNLHQRQAAQCGTTLRVVQVRIVTTPLTQAAEPAADVRITSRREVPHSDTFFGGFEPHQEGGPVWDHSPSGPSEIVNHSES